MFHWHFVPSGNMHCMCCVWRSGPIVGTYTLHICSFWFISVCKRTLEICGGVFSLLTTRLFTPLHYVKVWKCGAVWGHLFPAFPALQTSCSDIKKVWKWGSSLSSPLHPQAPGMSGERDGDSHQVHHYSSFTAAFITTHLPISIKNTADVTLQFQVLHWTHTDGSLA